MTGCNVTVCVVSFYEMVPIRVQNEIKSLLDDGYYVKVYVWNRGGPYKSLTEKLDFEVEPINFNAPEMGPILLFFLPLYYLKLAIKMRGEEIDIIHCVHFFMLPFCWLLGGGKKIVYDSHEAFPKMYSEYAPQYFQPILEYILKLVENFFVRKMDCIFTVDTYGDAQYERYKRVNENTVVLYNVPELEVELDQGLVTDLKEKYGDTKTLVYVGGLMKDKGSLKNLEVINELKDEGYRLLLIGRYKDSGEKAREYIEENDLDGVVEHIDWLPFEEMMCYLKAMDLGLALHQPTRFYRSYPSKGTGRKFFTYMQAGVPIVGPEFAEVGGIVEETGCGVLVDTTNTEEIAETIRNLFDNPERMAEMGEKGRRAIEDKYNWGVEKEKFLEGYREIVDDK